MWPTVNVWFSPVWVWHCGDRLVYGWVHAVWEAGIDGDAAAAVGRLSSLVPQLLLATPFRSTVGKPNLQRKSTCPHEPFLRIFSEKNERVLHDSVIFLGWFFYILWWSWVFACVFDNFRRFVVSSWIRDELRSFTYKLQSIFERIFQNEWGKPTWMRASGRSIFCASRSRANTSG